MFDSRSGSQHPARYRESHRALSGVSRTWTVAQWRSQPECGTNEPCNSIVIQITLNRYRRRQTNHPGGQADRTRYRHRLRLSLAKGAWNASLATHEAAHTRRCRTPLTASHRCRCRTIRRHARLDGHPLTVRHRGDRRRDIRRPHRGSGDAPAFAMTHAHTNVDPIPSAPQES
ncbi:hypothetical protein RHA1_ro06931 [Rhodococcus jostii RHA1]|uniref:Uncharacterized protein n=1 Tax=Rhodococcus jostii (strain RHA1) TaxID=101510 RepID=Q0S189_RHOJR|nr:hypothetical protein RHA1_ro06931 [Rhodococcus jostii RHA1]